MDELTVRDRFAIAALQGLVAISPTRYVETNENSADLARRTAGLAYELADAMLTEKNKPRIGHVLAAQKSRTFP